MTKQNKDANEIADMNNVSKRSITLDGKTLFIDAHEGLEKELLEDMAVTLELKRLSIEKFSIAHYELLAIQMNKYIKYLSEDFKNNVKLGKPKGVDNGIQN
tara:strand:- start:428 stop:730 length:303 start_codon:yes stop_codon:yes gene_type:complete